MEGGGDNGGARKVMVVADPSRESAAALQYALSHAILENDELILLHVGHPQSWRNTLTTLLKRLNNPASNNGSSHDGGGGGGGEAVGDSNFLEEMKRACRTAQPKIEVKIEKVEMEGNNKASTILSQIEVFSVDVLIVGQRRSLSAAILGTKRNGGSGKGIKHVDTAEYLIENSKCTCVAVQKKCQNAGYLLNTRTHRNFWLLA